MTMRTKLLQAPRHPGAGRRVLRALAATAAVALVGAGCHLLDVNNPDIVPASNLNTPGALPTIRAGAIGDFAFAYGGSGAGGSGGTTEGQILISGMLGDELINTETFPDRVQADARQPDPSSGTLETVFRSLAKARGSAEGAAAKFRALSPDTTKDAGLSEMLSLAGFTYVMFAEDYCSGVPMDNVSASGTLSFGVPLTTSQILDTAINRFNQALVAANALTISSKPTFVALAQLGLARANLDKGNFAAAATTSSLVPTTFAYLTLYDINTTRENDGVFNGMRQFKRYGVADQEGGVGLAWRTQPDPRTPIFRSPATNKGFDGATPQYDQLRYFDQKASIPLATGLEARLIDAEAALATGDTATMLTRLNALRAAPPAYVLAGDTLNPTSAPVPVPAGKLAPLTGPASVPAAVTMLFNERARWLWLTGHRLNDLRRLVRPVGTRGGYGLSASTFWPSGPYFKQGLTYGNAFVYPVPITEQNNPNFTACLDVSP
ncbi:MAG TPA: hypothetical protein VI160_11750 [Gemmatimonadales bacterium]